MLPVIKPVQKEHLSEEDFYLLGTTSPRERIRSAWRLLTGPRRTLATLELPSQKPCAETPACQRTHEVGSRLKGHDTLRRRS